MVPVWYPGRLVGYTLGEPQHTPEKGQNKHVWYPYGTRVPQSIYISRVLVGYIVWGYPGAYLRKAKTNMWYPSTPDYIP